MNFWVGAEGRYVPLDIRPTVGGVTDLNAYFGSALLGYDINLHRRVQVFAVGGLGLAHWRPENLDSENDIAFTYGGGGRLFLTDNLSLTGEVRMHQVRKAMEQTSNAILGYSANETFWGWGFTGGFSYFFGAKDSDKDGVKDKEDACPDTPAGVQVDARGCPVDSDGDGVADYLDKCPNTPAGARVSADGCPIDSDGDGVFDGLDRCPNTPRGATVDANGCPMDSDGDGVFDGLDRCPNTPRGTRVDANGCPLPVPEPPKPEVRSYTFQDVYFEFDSAVITAEGQARLRMIGDTLMTVPDADIEVHGHADSTGEETYNMGLSLRRANAVRDFLLSTFTQLKAEQFTVRNFGESQPVADNATREGRARNRRVEIKLIGG
jgi:outer membrane protein OmpA-like peptidoglycan-associated protein